MSLLDCHLRFGNSVLIPNNEGVMVAYSGEQGGNRSVDDRRIRELEHSRLEALVARNMAMADALHAEEYQLITPGGMALTKAMYLGSILGGSLRYRVFSPTTEMAVRSTTEMAVVRYRCRIEVMSDGQLVIADAWHTDIWQPVDGAEDWRAVWSQATAIPG